MSGVNKVILVGRLGNDPDKKTLPSGKSVTQFSLATSENWTKDGQKQEKTTWHTVVCWDKLADLAAQYLQKGRQVFVEGKIVVDQWEDKDTKKTVYRTKIQANTLQFLGSAGDNRSSSEPKEQSGAAIEPDYTENDVPL